MNIETPTHTFDEEPSFDDLQPFFDMESHRIEAILDRIGVQPLSINKSASSTSRRRMLRAWEALALSCIAFSIICGVVIWHHAVDLYFRCFAVILEMFSLLLSFKSIRTIITILRHSPYRCKGSKATLLTAKQSSLPRVDSLMRTVSIGVAVSFTLVLFSCTTTIGDGYVLTKNAHHDNRTESVEEIIETLTRISKR